MEQNKATVKSEDSNYDHEFRKCLHELISNYLDSDDDDDLDDELTEKTEKQIVTDKERDKDGVPVCKDFIDDLFISQSIFPYEDYRIIGDTAEIEKVIQTDGFINIDFADIISTMSTDTLNYVTVGFGDNIADAMEQSVDSLPINSELIGKMLFQILIPKDLEMGEEACRPIFDYINGFDEDKDIFWGLSFDESQTDNIKVILITSSK